MKEYVLPPLTPAVFYILLALSTKPKHGYEIKQRVEIASDGVIILSPGTLYGSLKRMKDDNLVDQTTGTPNTKSGGPRRKYYKITSTGQQVLGYEIHRLRQALKAARLFQ